MSEVLEEVAIIGRIPFLVDTTPHHHLDVSLEHQGMFKENSFYSNFSEMGDSIGDYGEGIFDDEEFSVKGEVPFFIEDIECISERRIDHNYCFTFSQVQEEHSIQEPFDVCLERHNEDGDTENDHEEQQSNEISEIQFHQPDQDNAILNVSINILEEKSIESQKSQDNSKVEQQENSNQEIDLTEDGEEILRTIYNRIIPLESSPKPISSAAFRSNNIIDQKSSNLRFLHQQESQEMYSQVQFFTQDQKLAYPQDIIRCETSDFSSNELALSVIKFEDEEGHHTDCNSDGDGRNQIQGFAELQCSCKISNENGEEQEDESKNQQSEYINTCFACGGVTSSGSHTILPGEASSMRIQMSEEWCSSLLSKRPEILFEMQRSNKKNVVRNLMRAFRQYFLSKNVYDDIQVFFKGEDEKAVGKKFKRYFGARKFNHNSVKQLVLHEKYGPVFKKFLLIHSSQNMDCQSEKLLHLHQVFIDFLLLCFKDTELLDRLETYSKTKNPFE